MSLRVINIALGVATVAASASVDLDAVASGAVRSYGAQGVVLVEPNGTAAVDANQAGNIETSPDDSTWTAAQAYNAADGPKGFNVTLDRYIRINNTSGTGASTNFQLLV